ncbi:MAG: serine/threonine protein kinase [Planctomycetes bacterium]|nr:serine/threonine protein kinase [Planctomycetota bacterium]
MSSPATDDPRLAGILEACYAALDAGAEPDLDRLCEAAPELRRRVARLLDRERSLWTSCRGSGDLPPADRDADLLAAMPRRIGDYELLEPIGAGGMSRVYRARQAGLDREVALKVLRPEIVASSTGRLRFSREATVTAALEHPNIVPVYAAGDADGHVYLAMRLLRGQSLDRAPTPLPPRQVATIGVEAASALQAAHEIGVLHRDIKPANLLLERGRTFVVDFGLAAFAHQANLLTQPNTTPGTLVYMAPELVRRRGAGALDVRTDVYSLGATLYEVLAGRPPFDAAEPVRALQQILHHDPAPLGLTGPDRDLETIVLRAMDKAPQRRFATAGEFAAELQRYLDGASIESRRRSWLQRGVRLAARHRAATALAAVALLLALGLALLVGLQRAERQHRFVATVAAVDAALAGGDLAMVAAPLAELRRDAADHEAVAALDRRLAAERRLQLLELVQMVALAEGDSAARQRLEAAVAADVHTGVAAARADAALAIASRLDGSDPIGHRPLAPATRTALPRAAAALSAWSSGRSIDAALAAAEPAVSSARDHLAVATILRAARRPVRLAEGELLRAQPAAGELAPHRFALATVFEAAGRLQSAYDVLADRFADPVHGPAASAACARLAAHLGRAADARRHLAAASGAADQVGELRALLQLTELLVLDELGERDEFWRRWHAARGELGHLAHYWLRGGYAAAHLDGDEGVAQAREHFTAGLATNPDPGRRAALEVGLLQLDWSVSAAVADLEPLADDVDQAGERARLRALAERAEALAARATAGEFEASTAADALLVAAQAWRAVGALARAWALLERVCAEHATAEALSLYVWLTGYRALRVHLGDPEGDANDRAAAGDLDVAAARALAYADRFAALQRQGAGVDAAYAEQAQIGAFLCAYVLGDAARCLPFAVERRADAALAEPVQHVVADCLADGGVPLDRLDVPAARRVTLLVAAYTTLTDLRADGRLEDRDVAAVVARWRGHATLRAAATDPAFAELWRLLPPAAGSSAR